VGAHRSAPLPSNFADNFADNLLGDIVNYKAIEASFASLSIFEFFNMSPNFIICEEDLRCRYFAICRYFSQKNEEILKKTHENYKKMQSPMERLNSLLAHFNISQEVGEPTKSGHIPEDIMLLSAQMFEGALGNHNNFVTTVKSLYTEVEQNIQQALEQQDWGRMQQLKIRLSYAWKLLDSAYNNRF
jgi:hypothetical protein